MGQKSNKDGRALERAVRFIQEAILESEPHLRGTGFTIESNKIVKVANVHHEIDVFIKTLPGSPYESTSIFECKDWQKPVGKNQVIELAEKVRATGATWGFLVARRLTKDAHAQLSLDRRLKFLRCSDNFFSPLYLSLRHSMHDPLRKRVSVRFRNAAPGNHPPNLAAEGDNCLFHNRAMNFLAVAEEYFEKLVVEDGSRNHVKYDHGGTHFARLTQQLDFEPRELLF
jgi:hypothetical protein